MKDMMMSWNFGIKQRNKIALAFASMFTLIVFANWFVGYSMEQVGRQFQSVYQDRLVPSLDISEMLERYYQNRMLLEEHILAGNTSSQDSIRKIIANNTAAINLLVTKFEATVLVERELEDLTSYNAAFTNLVSVQDRILQLSTEGKKSEARKLYRTAGQAAFQGLLEPLHDLINVQGVVGQELYHSADKKVSMLRVLSYFVIAVAVILALVVGTLLQTSRRLNNIKPQKFHLN